MKSDKKIFPKKHLGQNFLIDPRVQQRILDACKLDPEETVLEIGLGKGTLTQKIADRVKKVIVVEKDIDLIQAAENEIDTACIEIIHADILTLSFKTLPKPLKIISNLPYNIATPIIEKVIHHRCQFTDVYMTVQLEHALRLTAQPHTKEYGSFSCFIQYYADITKLFKIKNTAFFPRPKVQSYFLHLAFLKQPRYGVTDEDFIFGLIRTAFQQRRKTIINALSSEIPKDQLKETLSTLGINYRARPENLSLADYIKLCNHLKPNLL